MDNLFQIETANVLLNWRIPSTRSKRFLWTQEGFGRLHVHGRCEDYQLRRIWRAEVPSGIVSDPTAHEGPRLYEQTDYGVYIRSESGRKVELVHSDPSICRSLVIEDEGKLTFGSINFRSDVGLSTFTVLVDGIPEFDFEVEVFPSKIDYKSDYEQLIAETQDFVSGLVFEYLRSTYQLSFPNLPRQSSRVEWLLLLKLVIKDLERALNYIAHHPVRSVTRQVEPIRAERIKRLDSVARAAIRRGAGAGAASRISNGISIRQQLPARKANQTLDTPEHRWLALQLNRIRERLLALRTAELERERTDRRSSIIEELRSLEQQVLALRKLEPMIDSAGMPPPGFASLQLLTAPGYREAYRACILLSLGLQIEGGPINLSLKELSLLYEYWCYLSVVHLIAELTGLPLPAASMVKTKRSGLELLLEKGRESEVRFKLEGGRQIVVAYNRHIAGASVLTPQRPDILITLEDPNWPSMSLLLDAKYRVKFDEEYVNQFGAPGPPIDAVNALHRYRDAILESPLGGSTKQPKRTVIQAAALFPFREPIPDFFQHSKLWQSIDKLGIGAIPMLPGQKSYLRAWLIEVLRHGGWAITDRAIGYSSQDKAREWQIAAAESFLIGVLKSDLAQEHFNWVARNQQYYMPLLKSQSRQLSTKWVAIYSPSSLRAPGAVTHFARVLNVEIQPRAKIATPWSASHQAEELQVVYRLDKLQPLPKAIENIDGQRVSTHRWSSRLSLERAKVLTELLLESEPEWRLYEELCAADFDFYLEPIPPRSLSVEDPTWRTWFVTASHTKVRYAGFHGFLIRAPHGSENMVPNIEAVLRELC